MSTEDTDSTYSCFLASQQQHGQISPERLPSTPCADRGGHGAKQTPLEGLGVWLPAMELPHISLP